jgi:diguanylate cyclase (GGDEF)-like protein
VRVIEASPQSGWLRLRRLLGGLEALPGRAKLVWLSVIFLGLAAMLLALSVPQTWLPIEAMLGLVAAYGCLQVLQRRPKAVLPIVPHQSVMLDYANVLPAAVLMLAGPGSFIVLATACELSADMMVRRQRDWYKAAYGVAQLFLAGVAAWLAMHLVEDEWLRMCVGLLTWTLAHELLVALITSAASRQPLLSRLRAGVQAGMWIDLQEFGLAIFAVFAWQVQPALLLVVALIVFGQSRLVEDIRRAHRAAVSAEAEAQRQRDRAQRDALTGVASRLALELQLDAEASGVGAILMVDLDHFKTINDTYGHLVGDQVLHAAASALAGCVRPGDLVTRFGGEEFCILLAGTPPCDDVHMVAERLRASIVALQLPEWPDLRVTGSVGGALRAEGESSRHTLKRADDAVLDAKLAGRDRVVIAEPLSANITHFPVAEPRQVRIA